MKATKFIAAALVFAATGSAFAADAPAANAAATAAAANASAVAAAAPVDVAARNTNLPRVVIGAASSGADRAAVKAEAVEFVKNHKTMLAVQLDQYKN